MGKLVDELLDVERQAGGLRLWLAHVRARDPLLPRTGRLVAVSSGDWMSWNSSSASRDWSVGWIASGCSPTSTNRIDLQICNQLPNTNWGASPR